MRIIHDKRLVYLEKRFKELVYELHDIVIEESLSGDKARMAVSAAKGHAVCVAGDVRDPEAESADWLN